MNTALWITGILALLLSIGGYAFGRHVEGMGDGGLGLGMLIWLGYIAAGVLGLAWVVLLLIKIFR